MTRPKDGITESEKRIHSYSTNHNKGRKIFMKPEEINHWFRIWGIIGRRRPINTVLKLMPYFDRRHGHR